jgi:riboflavin synthase
MFTGLIQQIGTLNRRETTADGLRLFIQGSAWPAPLALGESMAVNGACLTVAKIQGAQFACDILQETLIRTTLNAKLPGARLNLERALRLGDPLGGHMVSGHVDGTGTALGIKNKNRDRVLQIACASDLLRDMVVKGSIAIDGVSLTIVELNERAFSAHLIPFTRENTTLDSLQESDAVNLETDIIGKHVRRSLENSHPPTPLTWERLREAGFGDA